MATHRVFDTDVQEMKYRVIKEVIRRAYEGGLENCYMEMPEIICPGPKSSVRCCIYKERAILQYRIQMVLGGKKDNPNSVQVIDAACDECPAGGIYVTPSCRGCMMHACKDACPKGAITIVDHKCTVDKTKCIECGRCVQACPYSALILQRRPCMQACKVKAISMDENQTAVIDNDKCISCGACVYKCPFGAITDRSLVLDVIDILKKSENNTKYHVYAVVAPAIAGQCRDSRLGQVVSAIKALGFYEVVEAALGADLTLYHEAHEWQEKKIMTTSCCPSFVMFIEKNFPDLVKYISHSPSPMIETAQMIHAADPTAHCIFIGPCASKKMEYTLEKTGGMIESVLSFEELQAFVDARNIDPTKLDDTPLDNASYYGRIFAKSGGLSQGVNDVAKEYGIDGIVTCQMNGIDECRQNLMKLKAGRALENFFEGMACDGGCINGPLCITHSPRNAVDVDKYGKQAKEKTIDNSVALYKRINKIKDDEDVPSHAQPHQTDTPTD